MRALLIANPVSGEAGSNLEVLDQILSRLSRGGLQPKVRITEESRPASAFVREALADGPLDLVIVCAGNGTVGEAAQLLIHSETTLGIIPSGTFNNIARSLRIPDDIEESCTTILENRSCAVDAGEAVGIGPFFEAAGAGIDATLFPLGEAIKSGGWHHAFHALSLAVRSAPHRFTLRFDAPLRHVVSPERHPRYSRARLESVQVNHSAFLAVAANGPYYGSAFAVAPSARLRDGRLTVSVFGRFSRMELLRHFRSILAGHRVYSPKVETYSAREVTIAAEPPADAHVDGRPCGQTPIRLRALPGALRVICPVPPD